MKYIKIALVFTCFYSQVNAQVKQNNGNTLGTATNSSAILDGSSTPSWNSTTNQGKGIIYPRVALSTFASFSTSGTVGIPNNYPTRFDGFLVYNTDTVGVAGVGATEGTLKAGYWYYDNKSATLNGGTWRPVSTTITPGNTVGQTLVWNGTSWVPGNITEIDGVIGNEVANATSNGGLVLSGSGTPASPYTLGMPPGTAAGQTMVWNGSSWVTGSVPEVDGVIGNEIANATVNGGLVRTGSGTAASPFTLGMTPGTSVGQTLVWNGTSWVAGATSEVDGVIGNEVSNATSNGGLQLSGSGTAASPYTLGMTPGTTVGQTLVWNGTSWNAGSYTEVDGVIGNEVSNATSNGGLVLSGSGTAASPFTLGMPSGTSVGQTMVWNGTSWNTGTINETDAVIGNEVANATTNGGLVLSGSGTSASPFTLGMTPGSSVGQTLVWNGTSWVAGTTTEVDGIVGNEVKNATVNGGLVLSGSGTAASPFTLGMTPGTSVGQTLVWNGTTWTAGTTIELDGVVGNEVANATANGGLQLSGSGSAASPFTLGLTPGTSAGQSLVWDGSSWLAGSTSEVDGVVGNEVSNATSNGGLQLSGSGTAASPFTLGLTPGTTSGQSMIWNGTSWTAGTASEVDGIIGNEVTNATPNGGLVRSGSGTTASPYTMGLTPGSAAGQTLIWNGSSWVTQAAPVNTTASNGLNMSGNDVRLGGNLTQATTIGTSATNTLSISGLQSGNLNTDSVLVVTSTGLLKKVSISAVQDHTVGTVVTFPYSAIPSDYLECNGAAVSRTTYAALFAKLGTTYGAGNGSTTFNLPDLRGEFIRGWDNGRGADAGRTLGSNQTDDFKSHFHNQATPSPNPGIREVGSSSSTDYDYLDGGGYLPTTSAGGSETRPRNVAMVYAIKANESILLPTNAAISAAAAANEPWFSQTTGTGATLNTENIYQTGNVGIGTTAPTTKLHVNASSPGTGLRLVDGSEGVGKVLTSDVNGNASWQNINISPPNIINGQSGSLTGLQCMYTTIPSVQVTVPPGSWTIYVSSTFTSFGSRFDSPIGESYADHRLTLNSGAATIISSNVIKVPLVNSSGTETGVAYSVYVTSTATFGFQSAICNTTSSGEINVSSIKAVSQ